MLSRDHLKAASMCAWGIVDITVTDPVAGGRTEVYDRQCDKGRFSVTGGKFRFEILGYGVDKPIFSDTVLECT